MATKEQSFVGQMERLPVIPVDVQAKAACSAVDFSDEKNLTKVHIRPNRWVSVDLGSYAFLRFNWVVSLAASAVLWIFVIAVLTSKKDDGSNPSLEEFAKWKSWISANFTWFYIGTQDVWVIFLFYFAFSKYGNIKLGKNYEEPEFGDLTWFSMLFACGMGIGLYFYGVSEPVYYYREMALNKPGVFNDDQRAQQAMHITFYHWGLHAWIVYILVACLLGVVCFRWDLPLTLRACFYPLVGDVAYGLLGDFIDSLSMAATTFGVCTSLGLGVQSINAGMNHINSDIKKGPDGEDLQVGIIWVITFVATVSVVSGLSNGLKLLSQITFALGCALILILFYIDNTWYILNVYVQSIGYYINYLFHIGWECDAFQQLNFEFINDGGNYYADSGNSRVYADLTKAVNREELSDPIEFYGSTQKNFLNWWTIFYFGWWISWAPFVGMFIARISRGRTIRTVFLGALMAPCMYGFFFLTTLGGLGIKMQRAVELALDVKPDAQGYVNCTAMGYDGVEAVGAAALALKEIGYTALSCRGFDEPIFDVVEPYGEKMAVFLKVLILAGLTLYFITSSDSGSYVDDTLSAGGMLHPPVIQRVYWAVTEGACACALLVGGKSDALRALQTVSITSGFPYTVMICFMCTALWRAAKWDCQEEGIHSKTRFVTGLFDWTEGFVPYSPMGRDDDGKELPVPAGMELPTVQERAISLLVSLFLPFLSMHDVNRVLFGEMWAWFHTIAMAAFFVSWIGCMLGEVGTDLTSYVGWMLFTMFAMWMAAIRIKARQVWNVYGMALEDFFACFAMWPFVASQLSLQAKTKADGTLRYPIVVDPNYVQDRYNWKPPAAKFEVQQPMVSQPVLMTTVNPEFANYGTTQVLQPVPASAQVLQPMVTQTYAAPMPQPEVNFGMPQPEVMNYGMPQMTYAAPQVGMVPGLFPTTGVA